MVLEVFSNVVDSIILITCDLKTSLFHGSELLGFVLFSLWLVEAAQLLILINLICKRV